MSLQYQAGITLVEILVILVILVVLAMLAMPSVNGNPDKQGFIQVLNNARQGYA